MPKLEIKTELAVDLKTDVVVPFPGGGMLKLLEALKALHIAAPMKRVSVSRSPATPTELTFACDMLDNRHWGEALRFDREPMTFSIMSTDWWSIAESDAISRLCFAVMAIHADFAIDALDVKW